MNIYLKIHETQIKTHEKLISIDDIAEKQSKKTWKKLQLCADIKNIFHSSAVKSGFYSRDFFIQVYEYD